LHWVDGSRKAHWGRYLAQFGQVAMAPSPAEQQLEIGAVVKLKGLVAAAKHNGCHGELLRFDEEKGRWAVLP
jgi:hypothetical protein